MFIVNYAKAIQRLNFINRCSTCKYSEIIGSTPYCCENIDEQPCLTMLARAETPVCPVHFEVSHYDPIRD